MKYSKTLAALAVTWFAAFSLAVTSSATTQPNPGTCGPTPAATSLRIAVMGDSIATAYGASTPDRSWPVMLKTQGATHGWDVQLHGVGSTTASQYLPGGPLFSVTETVRNAHPDVVTLDWRANEQLQGQTPAQLKTNLLALIDAIRSVSPATRFLIVNPPVLFYHGFYQTPATQADYTAKMWEVKQERGACWLDTRPFFPATGPDERSRTYLFDDIHPSDVGHSVFFAAVYTALLQACGM